MIENKIKRTFIADILKSQGKLMEGDIVKAINRYTTRKSGKLLSTPASRLTQQDYAEGELQLNTIAHQRFLDMGAVGGKPRQKRKRRPMYNKIIFGHYYRIAHKLMYSFTDEVIEEIKNNIEKK